MTFLQRLAPYWDDVHFRFLLIPFQLPSLFAIKFIPDISPLAVARLYFFSIYLPVIFCLSYLFLKLKDEKSIFIGIMFFLTVFLPGMNFQLSHINETLVVFMLGVLFAYQKKFLWFCIFTFAATLGHPAILLPFLILATLLMVEIYVYKQSVLKKYFYFCLGLILLLLLKTCITLHFFPELSGIYLDTVFMHLRGITDSKFDFITAIYLLFFSVLIDHIFKGKIISKITWALSTALIVFFIFREKSNELHHLSYQYRVFSTTFFCILMIYVWMIDRFKMRPVSGPLSSIFVIVLASWFTIRDMKVTYWFWKDAPALALTATEAGCQYTDESASFIHSSLPFLSMFHMNNRSINTVLFSTEYDPDKKLCGAFTSEGFPYQLGTSGKIHRYIIPADGFFSIVPLLNQSVEGQ